MVRYLIKIINLLWSIAWNNYIEQILKLGLSGVDIYVEGCECSIYELKEVLTVSERGVCYMPDYIEDRSTGKIKEIRFDKINLIE